MNEKYYYDYINLNNYCKIVKIKNTRVFYIFTVLQ